jgi:hypothetical protein
MNKLYPFLLLSTLCVHLCSCGQTSINGNGIYKTIDIDAKQFTDVNFKSSGDVFVSYGETCKVTATDDENLIPFIDIEVKENVLIIAYKKGFRIKNGHLKVNVFMPTFNALSSNGTGTLHCNFLQALKKVSFNMMGTGDLITQLSNADDVSVDLSGTGNVNISGNTVNSMKVAVSGTGDVTGKVPAVENIDYDLTGTGNIYGCNILAKNANVSLNGTGAIKLAASQTLNAKVNGTGSVEYIGAPTVTKKIGSSGSCNQISTCN